MSGNNNNGMGGNGGRGGFGGPRRGGGRGGGRGGRGAIGGGNAFRGNNDVNGDRVWMQSPVDQLQDEVNARVTAWGYPSIVHPRLATS